jgi:hypothetical protein
MPAAGAARPDWLVKRFPPDVLAIIPVWLSLGATREDIAEILGTTVNSLKVSCSKAGISMRAYDIRRYLHSKQWAKLQVEARRRELPTSQLVAAIVEGVVKYNLFSAVLGDYDDMDHVG